MTTLGNLVARSHRMLSGARREAFNELDVAVATTTETELRLTRGLASIAVNSYVAVDAEIMLVTEIDAANKVIQVVRGVDDTVPATHAEGARVEVNWRWFTADLFAFLGDEIRAWPDDIFAVGQQDVSIGIGSRGADLPLTRFRMPLRVRRKMTDTVSGTATWVDVPIRQFRIETNLPTSDFASGNAFIVPSNPNTATYRVEYAQEFDLSGLEVITTDIATLPLSERLIDAAVYGVAWRALAGDEASRSSDTSQPEPREAAEVRARDRIQAASSYKAICDERLEQEKRRLRQLYPVKFT